MITQEVWEPHKQAITAPTNDAGALPPRGGGAHRLLRPQGRTGASRRLPGGAAAGPRDGAGAAPGAAGPVSATPGSGRRHGTRRAPGLGRPRKGSTRDRSRAAKRDWAGITGRPYGVRLANDWRPDSWNADWDGMTVQDAEAAVVTARGRGGGAPRRDGRHRGRDRGRARGGRADPGRGGKNAGIRGGGARSRAREKEANIRQRINGVTGRPGESALASMDSQRPGADYGAVARTASVSTCWSRNRLADGRATS